MQGNVASAGTLLLSSVDGEQGLCPTLHGHMREKPHAEHLYTSRLLHLSGSSLALL